MTPASIRSSVVAERVSWIREMMHQIRALPLSTYEAFISDPRNIASAESYLRRGIEALLDLGRHILAKGFGIAVTEYKDICLRLNEQGILSSEQCLLFREIAGYRNRMVHFYLQVTTEELYRLATEHLSDVENILNRLIDWLNDHPEKLDRSL